jgi:ABC-type transport system substrate-binding protein
VIIQPKPGSHLYGRGFLGLIPLIGFFVGIGLILLGTVKYRNRSLVLIGIAALVPSVLIYGSLYLYNFTPSGKSNWTSFCKPQMDQLVKNIEFYKKEHDVYPDSLEQLTKDQQFLFINDPVQTFTKSKYGDKYIYKKEGTKYILFSMGVDGIPFTSDDIFPSSKYFDSSLTGLIRP